MSLRTQVGIRRKLVSNGIGELFNVVFFWFLYVWLARSSGPQNVGLYTALGLFTLTVLLLEGGVYWLVKRWLRLDAFHPRFRVLFLRLLYLFNVLLAFLFPVVFSIMWIRQQVMIQPDVFFGWAIYLFGVGEFVHYFLFKINMSARERQQVFRTRQVLPARFHRELQRAQIALRSSAYS